MKIRSVNPVVGAALSVALIACGGNQSAPTVVPTPVVTAPTPTPSPTPKAAPALPAGMVPCDPTPPPIYGLVVKVHNDTGGRKTLDSRPLVVNMDGFCEKAGFASSARFCFTRTEGDFQSPACDYLAVGKSAETGRWGPTWYFNGKPCSASGGENGCSNHPDNQFLVVTRGPGVYEACVADDIPLSQVPGTLGSQCGRCTIVAGQSGCQ